MSVALKAATWAWMFKKPKKDSPVHRTPGSFDSLVHRTPGSLDSLVHRTLGSHFKMLITQPRSKKIETALGHLKWDQEELFGGKNRVQKISWDCPFKVTVKLSWLNTVPDIWIPNGHTKIEKKVQEIIPFFFNWCNTFGKMNADSKSAFRKKRYSFLKQT